MTPMQELVANRLAELDLSLRRAADKSGGLVSHAALNGIVLGKHGGRYEERTLQGIALALDVPLSKVQKTAELDAGPSVTEFRLPKKAGRLTPKQRQAVLKMVDALLDTTSE